MLSHALACLLLVLLCVQIITTEAQSEPLRWCYPDHGNYTKGSPFQSNLETLLTSLASNTRLNDFYNTTSGNGTDQAYGLIYCRGDVSAEGCRTCQKESAKKIVEFCPNSKRAHVSYDNCWISYSADVSNSSQSVGYYDIGNATTPRKTESFIKDLGGLLKDLVTKASLDTSRLASGRSNGTYGLVQCATQSSSSGCVKCLQPMVDYINGLPSDGVERYRALAPTCFVRYEKYPFFQSSSPPPAVPNPGTPSAPTGTANSQSPPVTTAGTLVKL